MPGGSRSKNGVAPLVYVPFISFVLARSALIEMAGTSPAMTARGIVYAGCGAATRLISPRCGS